MKFSMPRGRGLYLFRDLGIGVFVLALTAVFGGLQGRFLSPTNVNQILLDIGIITIVAVGQMLVIVTRNIDLSVGSIVGLSAMAMAMLVRDHPGVSVPMAVLVAVLVGAAAGLCNGLVVSVGRVPAIIATLGTLAAFRGVIFLISGGRQVNDWDLPRGVVSLASGAHTAVPWLLVSAAATLVFGIFLTRYTLTGRRFYAVGSSPEAAVARGLPVKRLTVGVFVISGALAGLGGAMYVARFASINPADAGLHMEFAVISAVVIGGTNIFGGSGSILGSLLGCLLIGILGNGLTVVGVSPFWQSAAQGAIILAAVIFDARIRMNYEKRRRLSGRALA
ncbi:AI-2 transport system permease [Actinoplanes sp. SE50]|uniref:ABC transporter permease n=1 Tax=unclassified Actinoplanes TaxID=2626549 RepID=UPI00023EBBBA|nr:MULTISPECIES: ABC transporter permease [unclassified Actinoplanes]AEV85063.1 AI-2 transport system permease protein [Actinoplanes sp. SE50/110]ATO83454.1 AI-2 transport system permease [Actinoplanes sp. SE50]SLM00861.1 hypothetical protein ACSP50_4094 [Actinoplanes sp. SE50/110]